MPIDAAADSADLGYVADGVTEGVINNLSRLQQVRVMARSTVFRYKSMGLDPIAAGAAMKVRAVLIGLGLYAFVQLKKIAFFELPGVRRF
jgi:TolB-like protein